MNDKDHPIVKGLREFDYPTRAALKSRPEADMVMKGGITSGVVYPLAVCELAKERRFRALGGSSAGGIAAGLAAAAELGRDSGGFNHLAALPGALGDDLLKIFQPSKETKPIFRILLASMDKEHGKVFAKLLTLWALVRAGLGWFLAAFGLVWLLAFWALLVVAGWPNANGEGLRFFLGMVLALLPALALGVVAAAASVALLGGGRFAANGYGLCRGSKGPDWNPTPAPDSPVEPFTDWLHAKFNEIAGHERGKVVTFADLWAGQAAKGKPPPDPDIQLEMMTTNVTFCRPVRLPFESNLYFFCRRELEQYFPEPVIAHLVENQRTPSEPSETWHCPEHGDELLRMPLPADLPVLVAIRMSLSFPFLISAVPLFAIDYGPSVPAPVRCWFSDGGISSNFPIHFFDALWPKRPTFGISLGPYPKGRPPQDVYFRGAQGQAVPRVRDTSTFSGFLAAIADTVQNWSDEGQSMLPGYRDRIVEVHHTEDEGGMNLNMKRKTILAMSLRGHAAAMELDSRFDFAKHRNVRYRSAMAELDKATANMLSKYDDPLPGGVPGYREFIEGMKLKNEPGWAAKALTRTDMLFAFAGRPPSERPDPLPDNWPAVTDPEFTKQGVEPRPIPDLRIVARF